MIVNLLIIIFSALELFLASRKNNIKLSYGLICYGIFVIICMFSCIYSTAKADSVEKVKTVVILWFFMLSIYIFLCNKNRSELLMKFIVYSSVSAAVYLLINSAWSSGTRVTSIIGDSNQAGAYFSYSATIIFYCTKQKSINRIIGYGGLILVVWAILISGSRSSLLELFVGLVALQIIMDNITNERLYKRLFGFAVIAAAVLVIYHLAMTNEILYEILGRRIDSMFEIMSGKKSSINETSTEMRRYFRQWALERFYSSPIGGTGIGSFNDYLYNKIGRYAFSHNNYVELLQGVGLLGTIPYYSYHFITIKGFIDNRNERTTLAIVLLLQMLIAHYAVVFYYQKLEIIFMTLMMYLICHNKEGRYWSEIKKKQSYIER